MAIYKRLFVFWICMYTCLSTEVQSNRHTTRSTSTITTQKSTAKPVTSLITTQSTSTTKFHTSGTTYTSRYNAPTITNATSPDTATSVSTTDGQSAASNQQASKGSSTLAVAAGISITVAIAFSTVVIVLVLRNRKKFCFENTKRSNLDNRADDNHISLQNDLSKAPGAPVLNHTYSGLDIGNIKSKGQKASAFTDVTYQNTNNKHGNHVSEAHAYFVLEKDGFELKRNAVKSTPTDVHDYFVLEKQQPNFGNRNGVLTNEVHPYFVLDKQGDQPVHDRPPNEANPYFVLEKQITGNPPPIHNANALALEDTDEETYQEIDTDDTYAGIDDSREDNNNYDYTNKAFKESRTEISDNVYNHLNAAGDEYDHLGKGQINDEAMENNYDVTSSAV